VCVRTGMQVVALIVQYLLHMLSAYITQQSRGRGGHWINEAQCLATASVTRLTPGEKRDPAILLHRLCTQ